MATTDLDTLLIRIAADTAGLRGEVKKANDAVASSMRAMARETERLNSSLDKVGATIKGAIGGALSVLSIGKIASMTRESLKWADALEDQAKWLGVGVEQLQEWQYAARLAGVDQERLGAALDKMRTKIAEAASDPTSEGGKIFSQLGISLRDANREMKSLDTLLPELANKIQALGTGDKLIVGKALFGEKMDQFVQLLEKGSGNLKKMGDEARAFGQVMDKDVVARGAKLNEDFETLEKKISTEVKSALIGLGPTLLMLLGLVSKIGTVIGNWGKNAGDPEGFTKGLIDSVPDRGGFLGDLRRAAVPGLKADLAKMQAAKLAEQQAAGLAGALSEFPEPSVKKKRDGSIVTGGASKESELIKKLRELKETAHEARVELERGPQNAGWVKLDTDLQRLKATNKQLLEADRAYFDTLNSKGLSAMRDFGKETEQVARVAEAEKTGRRDLIAVLELEFQLRQKFGDAFVVANAKQIEQLALQRYAVEENRRLYQVGMQEIETIGRTAFEGMAAALFDFSNTNETLAERMRKVWINVLQMILNKILELGVINPIMNGLLGGSRDTLGGILGAVFGAVGSLGGGGGLGAIAGGVAGGVRFASGGSFSVGGAGGTDSSPVSFMATPGERVTVQTPAQVSRGGAGPGGAGTTILIDARNANDPAAVEMAVSRGIARAAPHLVNASVERVRDRAWRDPSYLPR